MARISRDLGLTTEGLDELMATFWNMRVATLGPGERINVTPLWFEWVAGRVHCYGRGQKIANLRRRPDCTVRVERNERYPELGGAMFHGHATVLGTPIKKAPTSTSKRSAGDGNEILWRTRRNAGRRTWSGTRLRRATGRRAGSSSSRAG